MNFVTRLFSPTTDLRDAYGSMSKARRRLAAGGLGVGALVATALVVRIFDLTWLQAIVVTAVGLVPTYLGFNHQTTTPEISRAARVTIYGLTSKPLTAQNGRFRLLDRLLVPRVSSLVFAAAVTMLVSANWTALPGWTHLLLAMFFIATCAWFGLLLPLTAAAMTSGERQWSSSAWGGYVGLIAALISSLVASFLLAVSAYWMWHFTPTAQGYGDVPVPETGAFSGLVAGGILTMVFLFVGFVSTEVLTDSRRERVVLLVQALAFTSWCSFLDDAELSGGDTRQSFVWTTTIALLQGAAAVMLLLPGFRAIRDDRVRDVGEK